MKKQWKLDNKGMTLLEVIVAFAIFAIAATILITGFNGALRIMGNSAIIKDTSQANASGIETGSPLDTIEGATVTTLEKPKYLSFSIKDLSFTINGAYQIASAPKRNDDLTMSMVAFKVDDLEKPPVPSAPKEDSLNKIPEVPTKDGAYWNPDENIKITVHEDNGQDRQIPIFYFDQYSGQFQSEYFKKYLEYYDKLNKKWEKGVVENTITGPVSPLYIPKNEHLKQLFFINEKPFQFFSIGSDIVLEYIVDFIYLGKNNGIEESNTIEMVMNSNSHQNKPSKLVLRAYSSYNESNHDLIDKNATVILYLPKKLNIDVYPNYNEQGFVGSKTTITIPAGYYEVPDGTDILKVASDEEELKKYKGTAETGNYTRTYNELKDKLTARKVNVVSLNK